MSKRGGFPGMGGFGGMNINQLMKEAKKMQADLEKSQEEATWNKLAPNQESTIPMTRAIAPESGVCVTCIIAGKVITANVI